MGKYSLLNWTLSFKIVCLRLEQDIKKLKADLQASRQIEQELRSQISSLTNTERGIRSEIGQLRQENELLQNKYVLCKAVWVACWWLEFAGGGINVLRLYQA